MKFYLSDSYTYCTLLVEADGDKITEVDSLSYWVECVDSGSDAEDVPLLSPAGEEVPKISD